MRTMCFALFGMLLTIAHAFAGPAEEAGAAVEHWSAVYNSNDRDALVKLYTVDAILFGTNSTIAIHGTDGIRNYFAALNNGDRTNTILEKTAMAISDNAVVVAGFYDFGRKNDSNRVIPARFTMVLVKRDGQWLILHHHSSPRGAAPQ